MEVYFILTSAVYLEVVVVVVYEIRPIRDDVAPAAAATDQPIESCHNSYALQ